MFQSNKPDKHNNQYELDIPRCKLAEVLLHLTLFPNVGYFREYPENHHNCAFLPAGIHSRRGYFILHGRNDKPSGWSQAGHKGRKHR